MNRPHLERIRAHKANLDRYCRLLATHLTELERNYIHKRITEEHAALSRLEAEAFASADTEEAHPDTLIAAAALATPEAVIPTIEPSVAPSRLAPTHNG